MSYPATLAESLTALRAELNEATSGFYSTDQLTNWIKAGCVEVSTKTLCLDFTQTVTLASGTLEYSPGTAPTKILSAVYDKGAGTTRRYHALVRITPAHLSQIGGEPSGQPMYFYFFGGKVGFWPVPGTSEASKTVTLYGFKVSSDITDLPVQARMLAVDAAITRALVADKQYQKAAQKRSWLERNMAIYRADISEDKAEPDADTNRAIPTSSVRSS